MFLEQIVERMPHFITFRFWFRRVDANTFTILDTEDDNYKCCGTLVETDMQPLLIDVDETAYDTTLILNNFATYQQRPEYLIGIRLPIEMVTNNEAGVEAYETLLLGTLMIRAEKSNKDPDMVGVKSAENAINWLTQTDFYIAPASTQYHESFSGGLLYHTLNVYQQICDLHELSVFKSIPCDSMTIVALTHDWCKIGLYEMYMRNVKNDETGKWEQVESYRYSSKGVPLGHGTTSMYIASKFFRLSQEEAIAIRWHMNSWNVAPNEMNDLQRANETYPIVHLIQFADQLAITNYRDQV